MARLTLVRHGEAAAGWGEDTDPGLSELGRSQAAALADVLARSGPAEVLTSPLRRCRETATPLADRWGISAVVEPGVGEIESPTPGLEQRSEWLRGVLASRWSDLDADLRAWADGVVDCLLGLDDGAVVFSHFVAINVAIGRATGDDRVLCSRIGNCSRTVITNDGAELRLVDQPVEVDHTEVL